jgi:fluoride exporter
VSNTVFVIISDMPTPPWQQRPAEEKPARRQLSRAGHPAMRRTVTLVAAGGVIGALARYGLGLAFPVAPGAFPWTTFAINVSGCLLIGLLISLVGTHPALRPLLGTGVLGGYTTFSTYIVDAHRLLRLDETGLALLYLGGTVVSALLATYAGHRLGDAIRGES